MSHLCGLLPGIAVIVLHDELNYFGAQEKILNKQVNVLYVNSGVQSDVMS